MFQRLGVEQTVDRWFRLLAVLDALKSGEGLAEPVQALLDSLRLPVLADFYTGFTDYNNIRSKLQTHCLLELWCAQVLAYAAFEASPSRSLKFTWSFFESAVSYLVQSSFYISLIIVKAVKNGLLSVNKSPVDSFIKALQKFNYETGIPLIKTLKLNNELVIYNLRKA